MTGKKLVKSKDSLCLNWPETIFLREKVLYPTEFDVDIIKFVCYYYFVARQYLCCCSIRPSGRSFISALPFRSINP
ncbi:hypothetical protein HMPREF1548_04829 [Clostridium sp. KLE 1755]|nr:hypothetical protein HMPREF1548_04829 [Clostridium sp. KLE 1755]